MKTPHPSITGMAAGFSLLDDLNQGDVIGSVLAGNATAALTSLSTNAQRLVKDPAGRTSRYKTGRQGSLSNNLK